MDLWNIFFIEYVIYIGEGIFISVFHGRLEISFQLLKKRQSRGAVPSIFGFILTHGCSPLKNPWTLYLFRLQATNYIPADEFRNSWGWISLKFWSSGVCMYYFISDLLLQDICANASHHLSSHAKLRIWILGSKKIHEGKNDKKNRCG